MRMDNSSDLLAGLKAFGLDDKGAKIYLTGVRLGPSSVIEIAHHSQLPRTTVYSVLEKLCEEGLFHLGKKKKQTVYTAEPPEILQKNFQEKQEAFTSVFQQLQDVYETFTGHPNITVYEGTDGFKGMWKDLFLSGAKEYRMITGGIGMLEYVHEPYLLQRIIAERIRRGIKSKQLIVDSRAARAIVAKDKKELRESRLLPPGNEIPSSVIIFENKVAYITTRRENLMILLASGDIAVTYRTMFDLLWQCAKNPYTNEEK